ncbi:methyl-accepting chemotaxis protein [Sphingomonas pokkalii]|uniref:Methyl-accepting chemotaxis protein n=1 Tax=Sphingomonas pokkalii TaxID=2175090 RepID=A0A2U0SHU0_9SPHN|nr:methyl-accepting chemotaxis protein [Sphingomonas pokkalii]PVX30916.1 methyl-accepting chemotaxis protein [Sphingomonas pokkalii]
MQIFANLKIQIKIMLMLGVLGIATLGVGWYGARTSSAIDAQYSELVGVTMPDTAKLVRVNRLVNTMMYAAYRTMVYDGQSVQAKQAVEEEADAYKQAIGFLDEVMTREKDSVADLTPIKAMVEAIQQKVEPAIALAIQDQDDQAKALLGAADGMSVDFTKKLRLYNDRRIAGADKLSATLSEVAATAGWMQIIVALVAVGVSLGFAVFLSWTQISGPLERLQGAMRTLAAGNHGVEVEGTDRGDEVGAMAKSVLVFKDAAVAQAAAAEAKRASEAAQKLVVETLENHLAKLADGDLTATIDARFAAEYEGLKLNFNAAINGLRDLIAAVMDSAETISTGSAEIAQASEDLARRTEGAAASLEETSAAVSEMDQRIKATAAASSKTVERATGAMGVVDSGRSVADEAMQAMTRVSESAKGIDNVIEGLDKIAFQTRVLAMNAAVEAGRAGEAGRGFAVVADLVSALAMRAEEEAGRARDQLTATQTDINAAVDMVRRVDSALGAIVGDVNEVHSLLETMATDNQVQASAVTQVATAVNSIDQTTQQNAAMVEQTSAAARNLSSEVAALSEQALRFNTGDRGGRKPVKSRVHALPVRSTPAHSATVSTVRQVSADVEEWASF